MTSPTYLPGVPCWVENLQHDTAAAKRFYTAVFGWEPVGDDFYAVFRLDGEDAAGVVRLPDDSPFDAPKWFTHVRVENVDVAAARVSEAGGRVIEALIEAEPAGRLAVVADPTGGVFTLWEAGVREGAQVVNQPGAWAMSALQTPDPDAAAAFYRAVFGWETEAFGPATLFRLPGYVGGKAEQPVPRDVVAAMLPSEQAEWGVDFWVADTDAAVGRATDAGGAVLTPAFDRPGFRSAVLADPGGAGFSISQLVL